MKKGLLFLNGTPPSKSELTALKSEVGEAEVYCTDGAYAYMSASFLPDVVVGDFDSFDKNKVNPSCEIISFSPDKDFTDGHLAVKIMAERGFTDIDIFGAYGGRPDMAESNTQLLALAHRLGVSARFCGEMNTYFVCGEFAARVKIGATVSVVPFTDKVHILYTKGLKYALADYTIAKLDGIESPHYIMGVSNKSVSETVAIAVSDGAALVYLQEGR